MSVVFIIQIHSLRWHCETSHRIFGQNHQVLSHQTSFKYLFSFSFCNESEIICNRFVIMISTFLMHLLILGTLTHCGNSRVKTTLNKLKLYLQFQPKTRCSILGFLIITMDQMISSETVYFLSLKQFLLVIVFACLKFWLLINFKLVRTSSYPHSRPTFKRLTEIQRTNKWTEYNTLMVLHTCPFTYFSVYLNLEFAYLMNIKPFDIRFICSVYEMLERASHKYVYRANFVVCFCVCMWWIGRSV